MFLLFSCSVHLQASFSSISPSFDYLLSQQSQQQSQHYQQQQSQQEQYSDYLLSPNQPQRAYIDQTQHSNSSSDTLVGIEEESSTNLLQQPITRFKEEVPFISDSHTPTPATAVSEHEQDCLFETSSTEELGLLSLRSSSDPVLSTNSRQASSQNIQRPQTSADLLTGLNSILPSFQETYQIKYSQLASFGLKMDEDCFNAAAQHQSVTAYHVPHPHHQTMHHGHGYSSYPPQHPESQQYIQSSSGSFYAQPPYETHGLVSQSI